MSLTEKLKKHYHPGRLLIISSALTLFTTGASLPLLYYPSDCLFPHTSYYSYKEAMKTAADNNKGKNLFVTVFSPLTYPGVLVGGYIHNSTIDDKLCEQSNN